MEVTQVSQVTNNREEPEIEPSSHELDPAKFKAIASRASKIKGKDMFARTRFLTPFLNLQKKYQIWLYLKTALASPSATAKGKDVYGNIFEGPNFATQDYLGLASNQSTKDEAIKVINEFGIHSGGAALAFGTHPWYLDFQKEIAEYMGVKEAVVYPTGWMAGYGVVKAFVKPYDHVIMDRLAHNCVQEGAKAATQNVHLVEHLDTAGLIAKLKEVRAMDPNNGILVISESLFSMDSDTPDLNYIQKECKKYEAFLLIDMAHDLGGIGEVGRGALETQKITDLSNVILMGSGSKVLSSNIGFVGCNEESVLEYMRYYSPSYMFSNVVAPPQCAAALHNLRIVRSDEGKKRRKMVMDNAVYLRDQLTKKGFECIGNASPIVIVIIGEELLCRIVNRLMLNNGIIVNGIEFPIVPQGRARLRLQLQAIHTKEHLDTFVMTLGNCYEEAQEIVQNIKGITMQEAPKL